MADFVVQGKKGNGKSLVAVGRMRDTIINGAPVATNLDLHLVHLLHKKAKNCIVMRVPDKPTVHDLQMIGRATPAGSYNEAMFGALVLDECATWFNSRSWSERGRKETIDYFVQTRKIGWNLYLLLQSIDALESQARESCAEHVVTCRRTDRIAIPYIGALIKLITGGMLKLPRVHSARVEYDKMFSDRWVYRGTGLFRAYDTEQRFRHRQPGPMTPDELVKWRKFRASPPADKQPEIPDMDDDYFGTHCLLTPWHTHGRYQKPWDRERIMRLTKIHLKRFQAPLWIGAGAAVGAVLALLAWPYMQASLQLRAQTAAQLVQVEAAKEVSNDEVNSQGVAVSVSTGENTGDVPATLSDRFAGYRIAAHIKNESSQYYLVRSAEGAQFTDLQIQSMGYRVFYVNECEIMITAGDNFSDKTNVFSPGCVPKRPNHVALELSQFPTLAEKTVSLVPDGYRNAMQQAAAPVNFTTDNPSTPAASQL